MFFFVPLSLILISIIGIAVMIWRKRPYLNKLYSLNISGSNTDTDTILSSLSWSSYWSDFFPELKAILDRIKIKRYGTNLLLEIEKLIRKMRLVSLKVDRFSDLLIKKIRRAHTNGKLNHKDQVILEMSNESKADNPDASPVNLKEQFLVDESKSQAFLKNEEERLIIEIAKNPKSPILYEQLGDLYLEMENFNDAKESYEACFELNPSNAGIKAKISSALEKLASQK